MTLPEGFPHHGLPCRPLERLELDSDEARRCVAESRPFVARVRGWKALDWDVPLLQQKVGRKELTLLRAEDQSPMKVSLAEFLELAKIPRDQRNFIIPNTPVIRIWGIGRGPDPELACLMSDFELPAFIPREAISSINLWASSGTKSNDSHCEPNAMANLNLQVRGKKHLWLFSPDDARNLGIIPTMMGPPYVAYQQGTWEVSDDHPEFREARCYETVLEPGDAVFIPTFWFHWFVHHPEYQLNLNVWWQQEHIHVSPIAANWTFMNALCTVLGGFANAEQAFSRLAPETQKLLRDIERCLLYVPSLMSPKEMLAARMGAALPGVPDPESGQYTARQNDAGVWRPATDPVAEDGGDTLLERPKST